MINFYQKQFGDVRSFEGETKSFFADIIKILSMGDHCSQDIPHWLGFILGFYNKLKNNTDVKYFTCSFVGFGTPLEVQREKLTNLRNEIKQKTPQEYFKYLWKGVYDQKDGGKYKYRHLISQKPDPYVLDQLWFVMCNFTGQATEHSDPWDITPDRISLKLSKQPGLDFLPEDKFIDKLKNIIFNLRPDILDAYENR